MYVCMYLEVSRPESIGLPSSVDVHGRLMPRSMQTRTSQWSRRYQIVFLVILLAAIICPTRLSLTCQNPCTKSESQLSQLQGAETRLQTKGQPSQRLEAETRLQTKRSQRRSTCGTGNILEIFRDLTERCAGTSRPCLDSSAGSTGERTWRLCCTCRDGASPLPSRLPAVTKVSLMPWKCAGKQLRVCRSPTRRTWRRHIASWTACWTRSRPRTTGCGCLMRRGHGPQQARYGRHSPDAAGLAVGGHLRAQPSLQSR